MTSLNEALPNEDQPSDPHHRQPQPQQQLEIRSTRRLCRSRNDVDDVNRHVPLEQEVTLEQTSSQDGDTASSNYDTSITSLDTSSITTKKNTETIMTHPEIARYGFRNYMEVFIYICLILFMISTTTFGVIFAIIKHREIYLSSRVDVSLAPLTPSQPATIISDQEELDIILYALSTSDVLAEKAILIPSTVEDVAIKTSHIQPNSTVMTIDDPYLLAAAYITHNDTTNIKEHTLQRYALATLYYTTNGEMWLNNRKWLSNENYCHWHGIICCDSSTVGSVMCTTPSDFGRILEIDLYQNNLVGIISPIIALLPHLQSIYLSRNKLTGTIPGTALGKLSHLMTFYASYNYLSGTIPTDFKNSDVFSTYNIP